MAGQVPADPYISNSKTLTDLVKLSILNRQFKEKAQQEILSRLHNKIIVANDEYSFRVGDKYYTLNNEPGVASSSSPPPREPGVASNKLDVNKFMTYFLCAKSIINENANDPTWNQTKKDFIAFETTTSGGRPKTKNISVVGRPRLRSSKKG